MNELSRLLIELRGGESGRKAAKRAGISHNYLAILEKGFDPQTKAPIKPSPETLRSLAQAYNYPYLELMHVAGYVDDSINDSDLDKRKEYAKDLIGKVQGDDKIDLALALLEQIVKYSKEKTP